LVNEPCVLLPTALEPVDEISKGRVSVELNPSAAMGLTLVRVAVVVMTGERPIDKDVDQRVFRVGPFGADGQMWCLLAVLMRPFIA